VVAQMRGRRIVKVKMIIAPPDEPKESG
jgi:hypothetical protein